MDDDIWQRGCSTRYKRAECNKGLGSFGMLERKAIWPYLSKSSYYLYEPWPLEL